MIPFIALLISLLLPSLSSARELSKRMVCQANMRGIYTTMKIYTDDDPGEGQATLDDLVTTGYITSRQLICPSSGLNTSNYIIVSYPSDPSSLDCDAVIMYEPKSNHGGEGGNVVFVDGHASFVGGAEYDRLIRKLPSGEP
jgi:prepilin-type processing-associated H-X9-DG protein